MRRFLVWTLATGMVFLASGQQALAKGGHEDPLDGANLVLSPIPRDLKPGKLWTATIMYVKDSHVVPVDLPPTVALTSLETGQSMSVAAVPAGPGVYMARIIFPEAGRWSIVVNSELTLLTVKPPAPAIPPSRPFALWAWAISGLLSLLMVAGVFLILPRLRRRRAAVIS